MTDDPAIDLDDAWRRINERIDQEGLIRYPAWVDDDAVRWQGDDWAAFLDAAAACGAHLVYVEHETIAPEDLARIRDAITEGDIDATPEIRAALKEAPGRVGSIQLGFAHGGVLHVWEAPAAAWFLELIDLAEPDDALSEADARYRRNRERYDEAQTAEAQRLASQVEAWVELLVEHPRYVGAKNQELRRAIACELVPEVDEWSNLRQSGMAASPENSARQRAAWDVPQRGEQRLAEVKEQRLANAKSNADAWADGLRADPEFNCAVTADERRRCAAQHVERRLGFPSADVRDRVLARLRASR
ncbi:MAG: hypothetical protein ACRDZV_00205 [Acidimicrobiia bacterium]